jgi:ribonuclease BN (tRNA processing enzyme)
MDFSRRNALRTLVSAGAVAGISCCAAVPALAAPTGPMPPDATTLTGDVAGYRTKLILLGTAGGPPVAAGRRGIASALVVGDRSYLIDAGSGTVRTLFLAGINADTLAHVFITHNHSDHLADLFNLVWLSHPAASLLTTPVKPAIAIHGPGSAGRLPALPGGKPIPVLEPEHPVPGMVDMFDHLLKAYAYDINIHTAEIGAPVQDFRSFLSVHDLLPPASAGATPDNTAPAMAPFTVFEDDRVRVTAILVPHGPVFPSFAYRFDTDDGSAVFSGDTAYSPNVARLAADADVLVHEVVDIDAVAQIGYNDPALLAHMRNAHTTAQDAGRIATSAHVATVALSHLVPADPRMVDDSRWLRQVRSTYSGRIVVGHDLTQLGVGRRTHRK